VAPIATFVVASGTSRIQGGFTDATTATTTTTGLPEVSAPSGGDAGRASVAGGQVVPRFTG
jgi:hypothetical protein